MDATFWEYTPKWTYKKSLDPKINKQSVRALKGLRVDYFIHPWQNGLDYFIHPWQNGRMKIRHIQEFIEKLSLQRHKMAFISGPRQTGKTTLAKSLLSDPSNYYNWDDVEFKRRWIKDQKSIGLKVKEQRSNRLVFDEIHKNPNWKNQLKGFFDHFNEDLEIIITGSAKLNVFRKGADSLLGRFFHFHVLPFGLSELASLHNEILPFKRFVKFLERPIVENISKSDEKYVSQLFQFSGFPEPLFEKSEAIHRIWRKNRIDLLLRQDLKDLSNIMQTGQVEILSAFMPEKVGSPLSTQSLKEDLDVAYNTIKRWLQHLENVYYHFEIKPYVKSIPRSLKKEGKIYLYDWTQVEKDGPRFENMVAVHLLKMVHFYNDTGQAELELKYLRTKDQYEVDFVVLSDRKPFFTVEVKLSDTHLDPTFKKFQKHLNVPHFQIIKDGNYFRTYKQDNDLLAYVISFSSFFIKLP